MRLISFQIKNFKSIIDTGKCELPSKDNIIVLAGQNEAGKSAILEALNFFRNGPQPDFERLYRRQDANPEVICTFKLEDQDIKNIFVEAQNKNLKNFLTRNSSLSFKRGDVKEDNFEKIKLVSENLNQLSNFFQQNEKEEDKKEAESKNKQNTVSIKTIENLVEFLLVELRKFVFYDTFTDLLPGEVLVAEIDKHQAVLDFQVVFNTNFTEVAQKTPRAITREETRLKKEASDNLNTYWTQKLEESSRYNFIVKIIPHEERPKVQFMIDRDDGDPLYMEQKSKGFRWFSALNLRLRALGVNKATIQNLIILIDEPGQGLHEKAQKDVKKVLEEIASNGAQIIYATHNPNLIGVEGKEFARIRLVSNEKGLGTKIETVSQFSARPHKGSIDALSPIVTAMGLSASRSLIDSANRLNVVVEGISDHYYFSAFQKLLNKDRRLCFIPACGVNNVPQVVSVLLGWGHPFKAVFDDDRGSGRRAYNLLKKRFFENDDDLAHQHVKKIKGCNGIEDIFEPKDFYKFILKKPIPRGGAKKKNSKLAEDKKEMLARLFLEEVENNPENVKLSKESKNRIEEVFRWISSAFNLSS